MEGQEQVVEAPAPQEAAVAPKPSESKVGKSSAESRRAAAFASIPDAPAGDEPDAPMEDGDDAIDEPAVAKPVEPPKEEKPKEDDALAARAAQDRFLQREREALRTERETFDKAKAEWEKSRGEAPDVEAEVSKVHRMVSADLVAYADAQKWTPKQRYEMAQALGWSSQPEDKRPAGWRGNGQGAVLSEVEALKAELEKTKGEVSSWKKTQEEREAQAAEEQRDLQLGAQVVKSLPATGLETARAFIAHAPDVAQRDLAKLAREMIAAERDTAKREYRDPKELTEADVLSEYDKRWVMTLDKHYGWAQRIRQPVAAAPPKPGAPKVPPAAATASPTTPKVVKTDKASRRAAAMEVNFSDD